MESHNIQVPNHQPDILQVLQVATTRYPSVTYPPKVVRKHKIQACHALGPGRKKCKTCFKLQETTNRYTQLVQDVADNNWLVVSTPLKNISQLGLLFPIKGKKHLPNHQPNSYIDM
jgi:hypothetical protein